MGLTRMVVWAPPGGWARPSGMELSILMAGVLLLGAVVGLDGLGADLRGRSLGLRHFVALGISVTTIAALLLGTAWWAWQGESRLERRSASALPAFVLDLQQAATPGRTLAIAMDGRRVTWSLLEGEAPRLGQIERGFAFGEDQSARSLAESVVGRLIGGTADDQVPADLQALGVANIYLTGGSDSVRMGIGNTPGLRAGTGRDDWMVWAVPDSGIAVIEAADGRTRTGKGDAVAPGVPDRTLVLAVTPDHRWIASLDGHPLIRLPVEGERFTLGESGGVLDYELKVGTPYWAWGQAAGLGLLIVLALPGVRVRASADGPRRAARGDE